MSLLPTALSQAGPGAVPGTAGGRSAIAALLGALHPARRQPAGRMASFSAALGAGARAALPAGAARAPSPSGPATTPHAGGLTSPPTAPGPAGSIGCPTPAAVPGKPEAAATEDNGDAPETPTGVVATRAAAVARAGDPADIARSLSAAESAAAPAAGETPLPPPPARVPAGTAPVSSTAATPARTGDRGRAAGAEAAPSRVPVPQPDAAGVPTGPAAGATPPIGGRTPASPGAKPPTADTSVRDGFGGRSRRTAAAPSTTVPSSPRSAAAPAVAKTASSNEAPTSAPDRGREGEACDDIDGSTDSRAPDVAPSPAGSTAGLAAPGGRSGIGSGEVAATVPEGTGEKFAALRPSPADVLIGNRETRNKNSLVPHMEYDGVVTEGVGTAGAKTVATMQPQRSSSSDVGTRGVAAPSAASPVVASQGSIPSPVAATAAHHAVEMIARIADAQAARAGSADAVSFGLRLGADSLTVRVELRDGAVRTQISTDAADLKSAIAGAWQGLTSATEGRSYHFAAPEFTGTGARRDDGGADSGAGNREPGRFQQSFTHREAPGRFAPDAEPETTAAAADSSNALRLHAVA